MTPRHRILLACVLYALGHSLGAATETAPLRAAVSLTVGERHACSWADGQVWCWGINYSGQLGLGHRESRSLATPVIGLPPEPAALALGSEHSCARVAGEVWCWGGNRWGQLGTGDRVDRLTPVRVNLPAPARQLGAGQLHTCAHLENGEIHCWGSNTHGQLGQPAPASVPDDPHAQGVATPVRAAVGLGGKVHLALGSRHSCAAQGSEVQCWGSNRVGQLGDGSTSDRHVAAAVLEIDGAVLDLATATETTCALLEGQQVRCWGNNYAGQAGVQPQAGGVDMIRTRATPVQGLPANFRSLTLSVASSCVTTEVANAVHCWGFHPINLTQRSATPFEVQRFPADLGEARLFGSGICAVAGVFRGLYGQLYCVGQPGAPARGEPIDTLHGVRVAGLPERRDRDQLQLGAGFGCVRDHQRVLHCFGDNRKGQLGRGNTAAQSGAAPVALTGVRDWTAGVDHACAVTDAGTWCWGSNQSGQLGDGGQTAHTAPVRMTLTASRPKITAGDAYTCNFEPGARSVWCWGSNFHGQLGVPSSVTTQSNTALQIALPGPVLDVQAGRRHVCALLDDPMRKRVHCWGRMLTPTGEVSEVPAETLGFDPLSLQTSAFTVCVRGASGQSCFGHDLSNSRPIPQGVGLAVSPPPGTTPIPGLPATLPGGRHLCSAGSDGLIRCVGLTGPACGYRSASGLNNTPLQSINCGIVESMLPAEFRGWLPVSGLPRALPQQMAAGDQHACAEIDGELYCWGFGDNLELGSPRTVAYAEPLPVLRAGAREPTRAQPVTVDAARACPGYYVGSVSLRQPLDPAAAGGWGLEILLGAGDRQMHGGLNFGGYGSANPPIPGYAAFRIASADGRGQRVTLGLSGHGGQFRLRVQSTVPPLLARQTVLEQTVTLAESEIERSVTLADGFHIVELLPLAGEPLFLVTAAARTLDGSPGAFIDGAVVGGHLRGGQSGFAAVCTSENQTLTLRTEARSSRGSVGAGDLRLRILDPQANRVLHDSLDP